MTPPGFHDCPAARRAYRAGCRRLNWELLAALAVEALAWIGLAVLFGRFL